MSDPDYQAFVGLLEKEKNMAMNLNQTKGLVEILVEQEQAFTQVIAQIIVSFLDMKMVMQEAYPKLLQNLKAKYYNEVAILLTTMNRYGQEASRYKRLNNALFIIIIFIEGFLYSSIARGIRIFFWDPFCYE